MSLAGIGCGECHIDPAHTGLPPSRRQRLKEGGLEVPHLVVAVTPGGEVVLRSNVSPDVLRSFGEDLKNIADELESAPQSGDTTH